MLRPPNAEAKLGPPTLREQALLFSFFCVFSISPLRDCGVQFGMSAAAIPAIPGQSSNDCRGLRQRREPICP